MATLPKIDLSGKLVPFLVLVIVVMAFAMGNMWGRLQGPTTTRVAANAPSVAGNQVAAAAPSRFGSFEEAMEILADESGLDGKKLVSCMNSGDKESVVNADISEGSGFGVSGTPAFFVNGRLMAGAYPYSEFKKVIDEELAGNAGSAVERQSVSVGGAVTLGPANAPVTIIEYSDFQCPFCAQAFPTIKQILSEYGDRVRFAYKHYPLNSIHPRAQKTAEASECARDQGDFWAFHDALFQNQSDWANL